MAESILVIYSTNSWSFFHSSKTKRTIHWMIQVVGSIFAIAGTVILYLPRKRHFATIHSVTGLISLIFLVISLINGIAALWSYEFSKVFRIKAVYPKLFHNVMGLGTFVVGEFVYIHYSSSRKRKTVVVPRFNSSSIAAASTFNEIDSFCSLYLANFVFAN